MDSGSIMDLGGYRVDYSAAAFRLNTVKVISIAEIGISGIGALALIPYILADKDETYLVAIGACQIGVSLAVGTYGFVLVRCSRQNTHPGRLFRGLEISSAIFAALNVVAFLTCLVLGIMFVADVTRVNANSARLLVLETCARFAHLQLSGIWDGLGIKAARIAKRNLWLLKMEEQPSETFPTPPSTPRFTKEAGMVPVHQSILSDHTECYF